MFFFDAVEYAFSSGITDVVAELERLQMYTKEITGELSIGMVS